MIWEYQIVNDMRISNYEWYENIGYENVKLWMIWEYQIMNDMRIYSYEGYIYIYIYYIKNKKILKAKKMRLESLIILRIEWNSYVSYLRGKQ